MGGPLGGGGMLRSVQFTNFGKFTCTSKIRKVLWVRINAW